jgi:hypothetical protein
VPYIRRMSLAVPHYPDGATLPPEVKDSLPPAPLLTAEEARKALAEEEEWAEDPEA